MVGALAFRRTLFDALWIGKLILFFLVRSFFTAKPIDFVTSLADLFSFLVAFNASEELTALVAAFLPGLLSAVLNDHVCQTTTVSHLRSGRGLPKPQRLTCAN